MPVLQVAFDVSEEIAKQLLSGEAVRYGGVVRDSAGRIIEHLVELEGSGEIVKEAVKPGSPIAGVANKVFKVVKDNKYVLLGLGLLAAGAGVAYVIHKNNKNFSEAEDTEPEIVQYADDYNKSLDNYYEALMTGKMNKSIIQSLRTHIESLMESIKKDDVTIDFENEEIKKMATVFQNYGDELRKTNNMKIGEHEDLTTLDSKQIVNYMIKQLKSQEEVFEVIQKADELKEMITMA